MDDGIRMDFGWGSRHIESVMAPKAALNFHNSDKSKGLRDQVCKENSGSSVELYHGNGGMAWVLNSGVKWLFMSLQERIYTFTTTQELESTDS